MEYRRYCAFISYRHHTPDMEIAQRLHTLIERYSIPGDLRKDTGRKHPGTVFRDQEELPLSDDLGKDIETALDNSDWLICICSPRYLESRWCMRELEYFIQRHGRKRVLTVLAEGTPEESFPETLLHYTDEEGRQVNPEPLAADVRGADLRKSLKKLKKEKLRILAPMLGTTFDGLYRRDRRRVRRNALIAAAAVMLAAAGLSVYTVEQNRRVEAQRIAAARNEVDLLLEKADAEAEKKRRPQALSLALEALEKSDDLDGYRAPAVMDMLRDVLYAGDMSVKTVLDSGCTSMSVSTFPTTEFFSPDGERVLCIPTGNIIDCCDTGTGEILWTLKSDEPFTSARWKADGSRVVVTSHMDHSVRVADARTGEVLKDIRVPFVSNAAYWENDIYITFQEGFLCWHPEEDPDAGNMSWFMKEMYYQGATGRVFGEGRFIAAHSARQFGVIDMRENMLYFYEVPYPDVVVDNYTLSPDGKKLFVHQFKNLYVCDLETDEVLWTVTMEEAGRYPDDNPDTYGPSAVWAGNYICDNLRLTDDPYAFTAVVLNAETGEILYTMEDDVCMGATADGEYFLFSTGFYRARDGEFLASSGTRTMKSWGLEGGTYVTTGGALFAMDRSGKTCLVSNQIRHAPGHGSQYRVDRYVGSLYHDRNEEHKSVSPDGKYTVISESQGFTVLCGDDGSQYTVRDYSFDGYAVFSPDSRLAALPARNGPIAVYDLAAGEQRFLSSDWFMQFAFGACTFSRDGTLLMYTDYNQDRFIVADMETGKIIYEMAVGRPAADWGFDTETGDAVVLFGDGSALCADIFASPAELTAYARKTAAEE